GRLDQPERADEAARHPLARDREVQHCPLRLRAPERIGGDLQLAHAVVLGAEAGFRSCSFPGASHDPCLLAKGGCGRAGCPCKDTPGPEAAEPEALLATDDADEHGWSGCGSTTSLALPDPRLSA